MQEKIGNVILDYTWYAGEDLYSDGAVEDELLEIAQNYEDKELNQVIAKRKSWPVLYHFSHIRQNIVEWLPITENDKILEIGSGCGAITGALSKNSKQVTCIELSKKRSIINAFRNRKCDNVQILVGNFKDIEEKLTDQYDYITLIGVFEYSEGYIGTENPYVDMLCKIKSHLKKNGKIIIAIENRLGLKYWAGCSEDHCGTYFEGLEGYPATKGVKTFSKPEIETIIKQAGDFNIEFYYPYPDYKFPMMIYSSDYLPKRGELMINSNNFDRERMTLFEESRVYDSISESRLFPIFSNSFLICLEKK